MDSINVHNRIANYLLLHSYTMNDVSLYHGKTGIVLAMMRYSEKTKNQVMKEYAEELFQTIYDGIHDGMPIGMEYGLTGVGYGVTMMKQYKYIDCTLNDILSDIDAKIMEHDPYRINDYSFRKGLAGILSYVKLRIDVEGHASSFDDNYIRQLSIIHHRNKERIDPELCKNFVGDIECPDWDESSFVGKKLGLEKGSSYYLFNSKP